MVSQRGLTTITALFLIVVMAGLAAAGARLFSGSRDAATLEMLALRGRQAADAGIERGRFMVGQAVPVCANITLNNLPGTLGMFTVAVTCQRFGVAPSHTYVIRAVACNRALCPANVPNETYVEAVSSAVLP